MCFLRVFGKWILLTVFLINVAYPTSRFGGTKSVVISTASILGGQNSFLGSAYIVVGTLCWALAIAFLARHMLKPRLYFLM